MSFARPEEPRNRLPVRTRGVYFDNLDRIPTDPDVDPPRRSCWNCWDTTDWHKFEDCPHPQEMYCCNCGRRGETMLTCPRCKRAYLESMDGKRKLNPNKYYYFHQMKKREEGRSGPPNNSTFNANSHGRATLNVPKGNQARDQGIKARLGERKKFSHDRHREEEEELSDRMSLGTTIAEDDFATAEYESLVSEARAGSACSCPSSAGATCCGGAHKMQLWAHILEMLDTYPLEVRIPALRSICSDEPPKNLINLAPYSSESITDPSSSVEEEDGASRGNREHKGRVWE